MLRGKKILLWFVVFNAQRHLEMRMAVFLVIRMTGEHFCDLLERAAAGMLNNL